MMRRRCGWGTIIVALWVSSASADATKRPRKPAEEQAAADPAPVPPPQDDSPWSKGVTPEQKATAQRLLGEGNELFVQNNFREALHKYEEAVGSWDHPAIQFNMVRTLIALDRPLEAMKSLHRALAFGKGPLEEQMYTEALNYQRLLAAQIAEYEVTCKQAGVTVKVDGESLLDCPGTKGKQTTPGTHVVVGAKQGYLTQTQDVVLLPGKKQPIVIELMSLDKATVYKTRWDTWKPWSIVGGGVVIAGLGYLFHVQATNDMDRLTRQVNERCTGGCPAALYEQLGYADAESSAITKNRTSIGVMAVGGAVVVAGAVGVFLNRAKPYISERRDPVAPVAQIVPTLSTNGGSITMRVRF